LSLLALKALCHSLVLERREVSSPEPIAQYLQRQGYPVADPPDWGESEKLAPIFRKHVKVRSRAENKKSRE